MKKKTVVLCDTKYIEDYSDEIKRRFENYGNNIILNDISEIESYVDDAYNNVGLERIIHYGLLKKEVISRIKNNIQNYPKNGWKFNQEQYELAIKEDSFIHLTDKKSKLTKEDVKDFLKRLPDIVANFDIVSYSKNRMGEGLRFKRTFEDGTYVSFTLTSDKKNRLLVKSISMNKETYSHKKRGMSLSANEKSLAKTSESDKVFAPSDKNITK